MIGNPKWFTYRIFGWGIRPKTWQGWIYVAVAAALMGFTLAITINTTIKFWAFGIVLSIFLLDVLHIMTQLNKTSDERENFHQLIIERNVSFAAVVTLLVIALYQTYERRGTILVQNAIPFDISLAIVLGAMLAVKIASYAYVKWKL